MCGRVKGCVPGSKFVCRVRCRANMAHTRTSRPDSGLGLNLALNFWYVPYSLDSGPDTRPSNPAHSPRPCHTTLNSRYTTLKPATHNSTLAHNPQTLKPRTANPLKPKPPERRRPISLKPLHGLPHPTLRTPCTRCRYASERRGGTSNGFTGNNLIVSERQWYIITSLTRKIPPPRTLPRVYV